MTKENHYILLNEIQKVDSLKLDEIELIKKLFKPIQITRNTVLEEQDKIPNYLYFINSGFMRLFYYDNNGEEQTTFLSAKSNFIASFSSLIHQTKALENVECISDCSLLKISYADTKTLIDKSECFKNFSVLMFEKAISSSSLRANDLANLNSKERYEKLLVEKPYFIQNIPLQYIASYLGIKPQSLSRIRKQIIK